LVVFSPVVLIFSYITSLVSTTIDFLISLEVSFSTKCLAPGGR
jgi:hypothetical protein